MPPKSKAPKRKSNAPPSGENKSARTTVSSDAPTSKRKDASNELTTDKSTDKENVGEEPARAVRSNRGRGGHAFQLANALKPIVEEQPRKTKDGIPENIPDSSMAPHKARSKKKGQDPTPIPTLPRPEAALPPAGPKPLFQMALTASRFGFSSVDDEDDEDGSNKGSDCGSNVDGDDEDDDDEDDGNGNGNNGNDDEDDGDGNGNNGNDNNNSSDDNGGAGDHNDNYEDMYADQAHALANGDMDIDEASPSEDEAAAQAALRGFQDDTIFDNDVDATDVVEDHRMRNRANNPPNILEEEELDDVDGDVEAENDETSTQRASRHSKTPKNAEPKTTTMRYYPPCWKAMLEIAKNNMRRHVVLVNAFPRRDRDLKEATLILNNTITEYLRIEGNTLDPGYSPDRDMSILVFNEHSSFRQKLKKCVQRVLLAKYGDLLSPPDFEGGNQEEVYRFARNAVHTSLKDGLFLRGGIDENGKCKNLAHPAIPKVIHDFFYTERDCLAVLFPEDFEQTVPDHAVALVLTCIQNCLEEYVDLGYRKAVSFDGETYRVVMNHHLHLIDMLKGHAYHGTRYETRCGLWARRGMRLNGQVDVQVARFAPVLNLD